MSSLLHELTVSQEELEIQNEQLRDAQLALEESRDLFIQLFELAPVAFLRTDISGVVQVANQAAGALLQCDPSQLRGRPLSSRLAPGQVSVLVEQRRRALATRAPVTAEIPFGPGAERCGLVTVAPFTGGMSLGFLCSIVDISERKQSELRLREMTEQLEATNVRLHELAMRDPLTGVLNRRGFELELGRELERARRSEEPLCALMIDCDNFKRINDSLGHAAGDIVLRTVANRLQEGLRPTDVFARVGGDEFLVLLPGAGLAQSSHIAERLRLAVCSEPVALSHGPIGLTVSLAIAQVDRQTGAMEELLAACRVPLHSSKQGGKNRTTSMAPLEAVHSGDTLLDAWQSDGFFGTVGQAIVSVQEGDLFGLELLCRGPQGRYHLPDDIFKAAAERGLLTPIDVSCLRACLTAAREVDARHWCHVNIYPSTLLDLRAEGVLDLISLREGEARICLELSEQQMLGDMRAVRDICHALQGRGVRIAVDDVGFGRSSLEGLIFLEPEVIKIDRRQVTGVSVDAERRRALSRLVGVGQALGADIVAEGVERVEDLTVVRELGIRYAQGFLWGRPGALATATRALV